MRSLLILLFFLAVWPLIAADAHAADITLVADEWCPYNCVSGDEKPGLFVEIAKLAFEKAGHKVIYKTMPWARAIEASRKGEFTGIIGAFKDDAPDFIFPDVLLESGQEFFVKAGSSWKYKDMSSLDTVSVGVIRDYAYGEILDPYIKQHLNNPKRIQVAAGDDALKINLNKLLAGRIDTIIEDSAVMRYNLQQEKMTDKIVSAGELSRNGLYIAFSPKDPNSPEYAKLLSEELKRLQANGGYKALKGKYGLE